MYNFVVKVTQQSSSPTLHHCHSWKGYTYILQHLHRSPTLSHPAPSRRDAPSLPRCSCLSSHAMLPSICTISIIPMSCHRVTFLKCIPISFPNVCHILNFNVTFSRSYDFFVTLMSHFQDHVIFSLLMSQVHAPVTFNTCHIIITLRVNN